MSDNVQEFTDDNFQAEVLESTEPVLVDFWAPWCGPCRMLTPTIEEIANEYEGKAKIGKMNVDDNQSTAMKYGISSIPAVLIFKGGQVAKQFVGLRPKGDFEQALDAEV